MNGIHPCQACEGDGFVFHRCGCREAMCPHESSFGHGDGTEPGEGLYGKYWVRRTDGSSHEGQKHADCEEFQKQTRALGVQSAYAEDVRWLLERLGEEPASPPPKEPG